jgi:eukaryotic-like serine/threonine-protein kinase
MPFDLGVKTPAEPTAPSRPENVGELATGTIIDGRYLVQGRLARGGMGEVYKAHHVELARPLAIKVMHPRLSDDAEYVVRFKREATTASSIGQANIVDVLDFGRTTDGRLYYVMEYLDGVSLARLVTDEGRQPIRRSLVIGLQIARALSAAHSMGIIHRDLKPANVMLVHRPEQADFVKVVDFGVAKLLNADLTSTGKLLGTPRYMAPEQVRSLPVDGRADIYCLGLIIYELLAGRPAIDCKEAAAVLLKQANDSPPPIDLGGDGPPGLLRLVDQMLAKSADERPQTMAAVVEALEALLHTLEGSRALGEHSATDSGASKVLAPGAGARRPWVLVWALAVAVALVLATIALWHRGTTETASSQPPTVPARPLTLAGPRVVSPAKGEEVDLATAREPAAAAPTSPTAPAARPKRKTPPAASGLLDDVYGNERASQSAAPLVEDAYGAPLVEDAYGKGPHPPPLKDVVY